MEKNTDSQNHGGKEKQKKEPWRILAGILSIGYIVYMWVSKDVMGIYANMPEEQAAPLIVTTVLVSLLKVAAIAVGILLVKKFVGKKNTQ